MRRAVLLAPLVVLLLAGSSGAGSYFPPPGDCCQQWSPQGTQLVFETIRAGSQPEPTVGVVAATGGPEHFIPGIPVGNRSPDWTHVAAVDNTSGQGLLTVWKVDGTGKKVLAQGVPEREFAWSPDSKRIAFVTSTGGLAVIGADGNGLVNVVPSPASIPEWSPNGQRLAYEAGQAKTSIHVVNPDGTGNVNLTPASTKLYSDPQWSPDSSRLAFWSRTGNTYVLTVKPAGAGTAVTYAIKGAIGGDIVWLPNSNTVFAESSAGLLGIDVTTGKRHTLPGIYGGIFSPDGKRITWATGGECRDRVGIYVANADGSQQRRLTDSCRIIGTPGPNVLHGDFSRVVLGLGGNDTLYADDTYYFFDGNTLYGGAGNDRLIGGFGQDKLVGGPGSDTITGGGSKDVIVGGPGQDHLSGGGGSDTIYARDGRRDMITCGTNTYGEKRGDVVYADRIDVVASDCEIVHR